MPVNKSESVVILMADALQASSGEGQFLLAADDDAMMTPEERLLKKFNQDMRDGVLEEHQLAEVLLIPGWKKKRNGLTKR